MQQIFNDGVMEATQYKEGWVYLRWINNDKGILPKTLVKDLRFVEEYILTYKLKGWFTDSHLEHKDFQMILHRVGAKFMAKDSAFVHFYKWIQKPEDKYVRRCASRPCITAVS